jgi:hypothetical protein
MNIKEKYTTTPNGRNNTPLDYKSFDYEFLFKINDDIICQRFFDIKAFNRYSDLKCAIDEIVELINSDLKSKTMVYMFNMCHTRDNEEQEKNRKVLLKSGTRLNGEPVIVDYNDMYIYSEKSPEFIPVRDENSIYEVEIKDLLYTDDRGEKTKIRGYYNKPKLIDGVKVYKHEYQNQFSFSFKIKGRNVITKIWSADDYPNFVRSSVDIANKRVVIGTNESQSSFELRKKMFGNREDLIPKIISIFRDNCSKVKY